jgi:hypothetical protein
MFRSKNEKIYLDTLKVLLAVPETLKAMNAVLTERYKELKTQVDDAGVAALLTPELRTNALTLYGQKSEIEYLIELLNDLRRTP